MTVRGRRHRPDHAGVVRIDAERLAGQRRATWPRVRTHADVYGHRADSMNRPLRNTPSAGEGDVGEGSTAVVRRQGCAVAKETVSTSPQGGGLDSTAAAVFVEPSAMVVICEHGSCRVQFGQLALGGDRLGRVRRMLVRHRAWDWTGNTVRRPRRSSGTTSRRWR